MNTGKTIILTVIALAIATAAPNTAAASKFVFETEVGALWQSKNDVQIPNTAEGTRFSLIDVAGRGPWPAARVYLTWNANSNHALRVLAAPLKVSNTGVIPSPVDFAGGTFVENTPARAIYRFNSWRLTYSYRFYDGPRSDWRVGFTAKIRDAKVQIDQDGTSASKRDIGFVPLLNVRGDYLLARGWQIILDVDALAGGPGRAIDGSLKLSADIGDALALAVGYRTVEGGADVEEVYNFAWLHYAVASATFRF